MGANDEEREREEETTPHQLLTLNQPYHYVGKWSINFAYDK